MRRNGVSPITPVSAREEFWHTLATSPPMKADAVVILGGEDAIPRCQAGFQFFVQGVAPNLVVSGGKHAPPHLVSAVMLRQALIGFGVAPDRITVEDRSQNTHQQAVNVLAIAQERNWDRLILVASPYHAPRAFLTFLAVLGEHKDGVRIMSLAADQTSWWGTPEGSPATRSELRRLEMAKIEEYRKLGHCASYHDGLAYLRAATRAANAA